MKRLLIIEDEPLAQEELIRLLTKNPRELEILKVIDSVEESVKWLKKNQYHDLIFMDIQLSDGMCFEILEKVDVKRPVIFTTAYDNYLLEAFKLNSIDYLLKPIEENDLEKALSKYDKIRSHYLEEVSDIGLSNLKEMLGNVASGKYKSRFMIRIGERYLTIDKDQIAYFFADGNLVYLITDQGKKYIIEYTLDNLKDELNIHEFFRLNRSYITNIKSIREVHKYFNGRLSVNLDPATDKPVIVSKAKSKEFINWLDS